MTGNSLFVDTNIALYLLNGDPTVAESLHQKTVFISFITELELLGLKSISQEEEKVVRAFLTASTIIDINPDIKKLVVEIRKTSGLKLPDSIILATSHFLNMPLFTADKQFRNLSDFNIFLYKPL